jgi:hypothetical protein
MVVNSVVMQVEKASAPSTADAPKTKVDRAARAIRILVDTLCIALFLYCQFSGLDVVDRIIGFWLVSVIAFPYARVAERMRASRESYWGSLVFGLLGLVIVGFGLLRDIGPMRGLFHGTPTNDSMLMGVVFALGGLTNVISAIRPHSIWRLLLGSATLVGGAIWLWFKS